jgi:peptide/nickel transport system substrate-binding protein
VQQDRIVVEKFADYWNKDNVSIDKITYLPIVDSTVRLANLRSGGLDLLERLNATDMAAVKSDSKLKLNELPGSLLLRPHHQCRERREGEESARPARQGAPGARACDRPRGAQSGRVQRRVRSGNQWVSPTNAYYQKSFPFRSAMSPRPRR